MASGVDFEDVYRHHADEYHALVSAEDRGGHLLPALVGLAPLDRATVLEVGAGTGRVTGLLLAAGARVVATERVPAMLAVARRHLAPQPPGRCALVCADARALPVRAGWADVALAGWVLGHMRAWHPATWRDEVERGLAGMDRALRPGGTLVVIETLGTGATEPRPPSPELAEYYAWLEREQGMGRAAIRTDYAFPDAETAARTLGFFFGAEFAARVRREGWTRVPECTGLWWRLRS